MADSLVVHKRWEDTSRESQCSEVRADVMEQIAADMAGRLITSAFLTLEIIPVVYDLLSAGAAPLRTARLQATLRRLRLLAKIQGMG